MISRKKVLKTWLKTIKATKFISIFFILGLSQSYAEEEVKGIKFAGFLINGRFDINVESRGFKTDPFDGKLSIVNYHHFLFVSREGKKFFASVQIPDLWYYEFGYRSERFQIKGGKIFVPVGADPLFHHEYGGLTGFDQKFVPFVWSEHGINLLVRILKGPHLFISGETFVVNAPRGDPKKVLLLTEKSQPDKFALGGRMKVGYKKFTCFLSVYWNQYSGSYDLIMPGVDITLSYGFLPFAKFVALKAGFLRPYIEGDPITVGTYYHFADYIRVDLKLPKSFSFRYIAGTKTIQNYKGLFYDKERGDENDSTTHNFALFWRKDGFVFGIQYVINLEAKEIDDDFMRFLMVYEF